MGRRISVAAEGGSTVSEQRVDFAYNAAGRCTSVKRYKETDDDNGHLVIDSHYACDRIRRLTSMGHKNSSNTIVAGYDGGNRRLVIQQL